MLLTIVAVMLRMTWIFILPHKREHEAFARLAPRLLYAGIYYDGPNWKMKAIRECFLFQRFHTVRIRIEEKDIDRQEILAQLCDLPYIERVELVFGDPHIQTKSNLAEAKREILEQFPSVDVAILP